MGSLDIMHPQHDAAYSMDSSDFSVIPETFENEDIGGNHFDAANLHSLLSSATPDMSLEEMQNRLAEVVSDNISLRETLERNNGLMDQQLNSIKAWHNELTSTMSKQQLDLKESKEKVEKLEEENKLLHNKLKEKETKVENAVYCGASMRTNSPRSDEELDDFEVINQKEWKNPIEARKLEEAEQNIIDMKKIIEDQNEQIEALVKQLNDVSLSTKVKDQLDGSEKSAELVQKIVELEKDLALETEKLDEEKMCHLQTKKMFNTVQTNYDRVTKLLQIQSRDEKEKFQSAADIEREMDTKMYLEQIDNLTAKLMDMEQKLQEETEKNTSLNSQLDLLKEDAESIPILRSQIDVYRMDLESATLARDASQEEVNRLTKQLHEASSLSLCDGCRGSMVEGSSRGKGRKKSISKRIELKVKDDMFICPICQKAFTSLQAVEVHANECADQS